ncbi:hypothetical protein ACP4OV_009091 [Aristida adscensionis]
MKLLGWMHRKLRQSNNDVFKEFGTGGGGTCNCITGLASPDPATFLADATEYFAATNPSPPAADLFTFGGSGLLTIGTLGIAAVAVPEEDDGDEEDDNDYDVDAGAGADNDDDTADEAADEVDGAATPTFTYPPPPPPPQEAAGVEKAAAAVEAIAEKDDDTTTEDDLMLVSAELEKVLGGRSSGAAGVDAVASARASFAMGGDCPLQGFLFGSPVSDAESRLDQPRDSGGGRRTSLGELFMRTRFADEKVALVAVEEGEDGGDGNDAKAGRGGGGGGHKAMNKRKVKDERVAGGDGAPASVTKSKFQKILQIFHRKVYPESTALARSLTKKGRKRCGGADELEPPATSKLRCRKEQRVPAFGCCANRASFGGAASPVFDDDGDDGELNGNMSGHWIKTDADCEFGAGVIEGESHNLLG